MESRATSRQMTLSERADELEHHMMHELDAKIAESNRGQDRDQIASVQSRGRKTGHARRRGVDGAEIPANIF